MPFKSKEKKRDYMKMYLQKNKKELRLKRYLKRQGINNVFVRKGVRMSPITEFKKGDRTYLGTKECLNCKEIYQIESGPQKYCKKCSPNHVAYRYMKSYGLTHEEHKKLIDKNNNLCWLCNKRKAIRIDHDHKTGKVRGVLCGFCNQSLAMIDNEQKPLEMIEKIKKYLLI